MSNLQSILRIIQFGETISNAPTAKHLPVERVSNEKRDQTEADTIETDFNLITTLPDRSIINVDPSMIEAF